MPRIAKMTPQSISDAVSILRDGGLVALPTETVYGLAADAMDDAAVAKIYAAKGRPSHNPLIVHLLHRDDVENFAKPNQMAMVLIDVFWPGPLTLVLPNAKQSVSRQAGAGLETIALRCPKTHWAKAFIEAGYRGPIVMPSANRSGHVSPTTAGHVADDLGDRVDLILDGGNCPNGIESTILKIENDHAILLRPGAIPAEDFAPYISDLRLPVDDTIITAPGMLKSHYAPKASIRLNAKDKRPGEAYLAFGRTEIAEDFNLSKSGDLAEAARNLYGALRSLDIAPVIAVAPIPNSGLGEAINDRLQRAAADKDK